MPRRRRSATRTWRSAGRSASTGSTLIRAAAARKRPGEPVNILTHCNAGWLATIDWGTATAPIYLAQEAGIPVHVWVDETRPRNQGASLTAFELLHQERAAHRDRRQCRRPPDAARHGRSVHRRHRPHHPHRRRRQQDRHLPQGAGRPRQWRAVLRGAALDHDRLDACATAWRSRSSSAAPRR